MQANSRSFPAALGERGNEIDRERRRDETASRECNELIRDNGEQSVPKDSSRLPSSDISVECELCRCVSYRMTFSSVLSTELRLIHVNVGPDAFLNEVFVFIASDESAI